MSIHGPELLCQFAIQQIIECQLPLMAIQTLQRSATKLQRRKFLYSKTSRTHLMLVLQIYMLQVKIGTGSLAFGQWFCCWVSKICFALALLASNTLKPDF